MNDHHVISPTAYLTAYWRSMLDIPYAKDISDKLDAKEVSRDILGDIFESASWYGIMMIESRNKALKREVERIGCKNIYGIAEGALPTGLNMTVDPEVLYVHTDLPDMLSASEEVIEGLMKRDSLKRPNLKFMSVNVLDKKQMQEGALLFVGKPFVMTNKGLLVYLTLSEKIKTIENIRDVMRDNNGLAWITTDILFKDVSVTNDQAFGPEYAKVIKKMREKIAEKTNGRGVGANFFSTEDEAHKLFDQIGFSYKRYPLYDGSFTFDSFSGAPEEVKNGAMKLFKDRYIYVLTLK